MSDLQISLCLIAETGAAGLLRIAVPQHFEMLRAIAGELIVAGDLKEVSAPSSVKLISAPEEAAAGLRGRLRNLCLAQARGKLILSCDATALLGPIDWPSRLLNWARPIDERVPYFFGFEVQSMDGGRSWDWIRVDPENRITLVDYGEVVGGLAVGAGQIGMSRAAWELSGGFCEDKVGAGEEIELSLRANRERRIPMVFCDALFALQAYGRGSANRMPRGDAARMEAR